MCVCSIVVCYCMFSESHSHTSMSDVLRLILLQTIQSLTDPQWELRRIAQQVFVLS